MITKWTLTIPELSGDEPRNAYVYVPDEWEENPDHRYPVLYMFDGHNVFFDEDATYGKSWGMAEYASLTGLPMIIAAVECSHAPNGRLSEYSPYTFDDRRFGHVEGRGEATMEWLVNEFKPMIDEEFPTIPEREFTFIAGSSMGGLMSLYAMIRYKKYFSAAACLSPSVSLCTPQLRKAIEKAGSFADCRIYMDMGSEEMQGRECATMDRLLTLCHLLTNGGAVCYPRIAMGGGHNEASWEKQIPVFMEFLLRGK